MLTSRADSSLILGDVLEGDGAGRPLGFDLNKVRSGRLLLQASSGAGKSETVKKISTLTIPLIPNIIVDPEGEYAAMRSQLPFLLVGPGGEVPAQMETVEEVVQLILETGVSVIFDLFELGTRKYEYARRLFVALDEAPRRLWRDLLIVVDEAHAFAPKDVSIDRPSAEAFANLASRGRKRGYAIIPATQQLTQLHNSVAALCENFLFGRTGLIDQPRTAQLLGYAGAQARDFRKAIGELNDGDFYAYGRAFDVTEPTVFHVDRVPGPTLAKAARNKERKAPPTPESIRALLPKFEALPQEVEKKAATERDLRRELEASQKSVRDLQRQLAKVPVPKSAPVVAAAPTIDKEKLRMLAKKLDVLSAGLAEALTAANEQEERNARAAALIDELRKLLVPQTAMGKVLRKTAEAKDAAVGLAKELMPGETRVVAVPVVPAEARTEAAPAPSFEGGDASLSGPEQKVLNTVVWLERSGIPDPAIELVAYLSGYTTSSSSFKNPRAKLNTAGHITYPQGGRLRSTDSGAALAVCPEAPATAETLQEAVLSKMTGPEAKLLRILLAAYPESVTAADLAEQSGYTTTSSSFKNPRATLKTLGFADYPTNGTIVATPLLFPEV